MTTASRSAHACRDTPDLASGLDTDLFATIADERRLVVLDGVHNFRDLGGYPADGGTTRWGLVYRADGLQRLTVDDVAELGRLGLGIVIDLRTDAELNERGQFPVDQHAVTFHHLPVIDQTWIPGEIPSFDNAHDFLLWAYRDMLQVGADRLAAGLNIIAAAGDTPLVFHCAAGKDRTGLLAALLLGVLGVPHEFIAADYAKTGEAMGRIRAAWAALVQEQSAELAAKGITAPVGDANGDRRHFFESPATVMHELLDELTASHGSVVQFVKSLGVDDTAIAALQDRLIETPG